jgi:ElaB/YqjD/DUF883 family membrane-anchored ribosome-binding protein
MGPHESSLVDSATQAAEQVIRSSRRSVQRSLDDLAGQVDEARARTGSALDRLDSNARALAHRSMDAVRDGSHQLRQGASHALDSTTANIRDEPIKAVLIAAVAGAALMGLATLFSRSRHPRS